MFSNLAELIISIEEGECEDVKRATDILATARLTVLDANLRASERKVDFVFGRKVYGREEDVEFLHETIEY